ncbi:hypothetical protein K439DRAFT_1624716 [Ramaria rubella]|nr:hypothetical protein K439DRAFT_1624716 [Ramaria rubella]
MGLLSDKIEQIVDGSCFVVLNDSYKGDRSYKYYTVIQKLNVFTSNRNRDVSGVEFLSEFGEVLDVPYMTEYTLPKVLVHIPPDYLPDNPHSKSNLDNTLVNKTQLPRTPTTTLTGSYWEQGTLTDTDYNSHTLSPLHSGVTPTDVDPHHTPLGTNNHDDDTHKAIPVTLVTGKTNDNDDDTYKVSPVSEGTNDNDDYTHKTSPVREGTYYTVDDPHQLPVGTNDNDDYTHKASPVCGRTNYTVDDPHKVPGTSPVREGTNNIVDDLYKGTNDNDDDTHKTSPVREGVTDNDDDTHKATVVNEGTNYNGDDPHKTTLVKGGNKYTDDDTHKTPPDPTVNTGTNKDDADPHQTTSPRLRPGCLTELPYTGVRSCSYFTDHVRVFRGIRVSVRVDLEEVEKFKTSEEAET